MIFFPFDEVNKNIGGAERFMQNLKGYLGAKRFSYATTLEASNGLFFPISYDVNEVKRHRRLGETVIQRLDGVYYPSKHGVKSIELNRETELIYNNLASHVVFQSEYSKAQCFEVFGEKDNNDYSLIVNGVNGDIFFPVEKKEKKERVRFITTGHYRDRGMLVPIIEALDKLEGAFDFELWVVGPVRLEELNQYLDRPYIEYKGSHDIHGIAALLRESDVFIYSHLNPPCPNSVVEAITTGLPVVGFDSGAMSELCFFNQDLLAYVSEDIFQTYEQFDSVKLAEKIKLCVERFDEFKQCALDNAHLYDFEECGRKYVEVFERELSKAKPVGAMRRLYASAMYNVDVVMSSLSRTIKRIKKVVLSA